MIWIIIILLVCVFLFVRWKIIRKRDEMVDILYNSPLWSYETRYDKWKKGEEGERFRERLENYLKENESLGVYPSEKDTSV